MKQFSLIITLSLAFICHCGIVNAARPVAARDTFNQYVIDNKTVDEFDGTQLEGKKIVSYRISTVRSSAEDAIRIHNIRPTGAAQSADPVYVIDGKLASKKQLEKLAPARIKSMTIVKNGSVKEVRQYPGWENGVFLIETWEEDPVPSSKDAQVNIGYGTTTNRDLSYSVSTVKPEENEFYTNMYDYLRGKVAGVEVHTDNTIFIRGHNSMNASMAPLILLDGVEITDLSLVNPYDVYSVTVLKDASSAIYGMKGANGVILITTKLGQQAKEHEIAVERMAKEEAKAARKARRAH